jgi:hypothetical protein
MFQLFHTQCKVCKLPSHQRNSKKGLFVHTPLSPQLSHLSLSPVKSFNFRFLHREDWYPRIHDGDVVQISIFFDEDQEVFPGPGERKTQPDTAGPYPAEHSAAHTAGPHDQLCRCVPCSLAALLSLT